jgi:flagellar assembly protein FliH
MRLSNILKAKKAAETVLDFDPPKFELDSSAQAKAYVERRKQDSTKFRMAEVIRMQTGVKEIEDVSSEESIQKRVVEELKQVQEKAYKEAYQLGLTEGIKKAFEEKNLEIDVGLKQMEAVIDSVVTLKKELVRFNETHLVKLLFHFASRIAGKEVTLDNTLVLDFIKQAVEKAQSEEEIVLNVSNDQFQFVEELRNSTQREMEFLKKVKLVANEAVKAGGCIVQTNYGEIDARTDERVQKLWEQLSESLYRVKEKVSAA